MIPYGQHFIDDEDIAAVVDTLKHGMLTQGGKVTAFEQSLCQFTGAQYAVAVNSGTSALHIACLALGVNTGDLVWTTPNTFAASANCALYCGASVDFVDIAPDTRLICIDRLAKKLATAAEQGTLPRVLIVVHFAGHMCDMASISALATQYGVKVIEDAAHALGASYRGIFKAGYPEYSDVTVFSFHPVKSIATAEGGAVLTNNKTLSDAMRSYATHGITKDSAAFQCPFPGAGHYEQQSLGFNYRLSDIHACLGLSQMNKLNSFIDKRLALAKRYDKLLADLPVKKPIVDEHSAWHLYVIELTTHDREVVFKQLHERGIGVNVHYIPVHWHPYYQQLGFKKGQFPNSETYYRKAITLPLFPMLSADNQDKVVEALREILA